MADFTKDSAADIVADQPGINMGTTGSLHLIDWGTEDAYWRDNYRTRPYASADRGYEHYQRAYRFGGESAARFEDRDWADAERDLQLSWERDHGSHGAWGDVKHAVRDAWDRVSGRRRARVDHMPHTTDDRASDAH